ncbi:putative sulfate transporter 3.4 [Bienertia sinuspersici]
MAIGYLPKGLNPPSVNMLYFHGSYLALAIKIGIVSNILALIEGIAVEEHLQPLTTTKLMETKKCGLLALSFLRSAVNCNAGAQTALSNIMMVTPVLITLLFLMPLFYYTPNVVLTAIIITIVIGIIDYQAAFRLWKANKVDFLGLYKLLRCSLCFSSSWTCYFVGMSLFKILLHVTRPNTSSLGNVRGTQIYQSLRRYRKSMRISYFLILSSVKSPIYFVNSTYIKERLE